MNINLISCVLVFINITHIICNIKAENFKYFLEMCIRDLSIGTKVEHVMYVVELIITV